MNPKFDAQLERMAEIHERKSHDYATAANPYSNFEYAAIVAEPFADPMDRTFATMLGIKLARLAELTASGKTPQNESIRDTFDDLATYAALWASYED